MGKKPIQAFLGIDGGGSKTRALLIDFHGSPISEGDAPGSNPHNIGYPRAASHIDQAVHEALDNAGQKDLEIISAFCGIAGIRDSGEQGQLANELTRFSWAETVRLAIDHDLSIAYAAALEEEPGIVLICGTGSSCLGKDASGRIVRCSGRADSSNDPGSGYALGLEAIEAGLLSKTSEDRRSIAKLAPQLIKLAQQGNPRARNILESNADALIALARDAHSRLDLEDAFQLGVIGGLGSADGLYRNLLLAKTASAFPAAVIRFAKISPVEAAAQLALRQFA